MIGSLTEKELMAIEDQLTHEQNLIGKYKAYSQSCTDNALKNKYDEIVARHQKHFDTLYHAISN